MMLSSGAHAIPCAGTDLWHPCMQSHAVSCSLLLHADFLCPRGHDTLGPSKNTSKGDIRGETKHIVHEWIFVHTMAVEYVSEQKQHVFGIFTCVYC